MNNEKNTIPYHTFRFIDSPFRWLLCFILWNIGCGLDKLGVAIQRHHDLITSLIVLAMFTILIWAWCTLALFLEDVVKTLIGSVCHV